MSDWDAYNWDIVQVIPRYTAAFSVLGSGWILVEFLINKRLRWKSYNRILFGMSLFDFLTSLAFFIGNRGWGKNMVKDSWLAGNGRCNATGFLTYAGAIGIPAYNALLALYFYLSIRHSWKDERIYRTFERYGHCLIVPIALGLAVVPLVLDLFGEYYFFCFPTANLNLGDRDAKAVLALFIIFWGMVYGSAIFVAFTMVSIFRHVYKIRAKSLTSNIRMVRSSSFGSMSCSSGDELPTVAPKQNIPLSMRLFRKDVQTQRVAIMAALYTIPFIITWVIPVTIFIIQSCVWLDNRGKVVPGPQTTFAMTVYCAVVLPIQGIFNWLIYMQPRFRRWGLMQKCIASMRRSFSRMFGNNEENPESNLANSLKCSNHASQVNGPPAAGDELEGQEERPVNAAIGTSSSKCSTKTLDTKHEYDASSTIEENNRETEVKDLECNEILSNVLSDGDEEGEIKQLS